MDPQPLSRSDRTREKILQAAIAEFSEHGLAGARISAIAAAAQVNKALLYYYFNGKEALYTAALEEVANSVASRAIAVLELDCSPGERFLRFALQHFDRILSQQGFQALMQQEMIRYRKGESHAMAILAQKAFGPMFNRLLSIIEDGIRCSELCHGDAMQMAYAALGANVFYFLSAPMVQLISADEPLVPGAVARRRTAAIQFLGQALFTDRRRGAELAESVLASMPMPEISPQFHPG
ncbi:MAG TPA: TetR/AcrR family transcriptional regulator, partial [Acidobacteriaceae bacterium]|nr:TetR/AcrR family transcriptional regulator [Acidobacteriaceae bacterium]